jgi:hypothetical protein
MVDGARPFASGGALRGILDVIPAEAARSAAESRDPFRDLDEGPGGWMKSGC